MLVPGAFHSIWRSLEFQDMMAGHEEALRFCQKQQRREKAGAVGEMKTAGLSTCNWWFRWKKQSSKKLTGVIGFELKPLFYINLSRSLYPVFSVWLGEGHFSPWICFHMGEKAWMMPIFQTVYRISLMAQCLRLCTSNAEGMGLIPGYGTKSPHAS